jgi:lipid II:glycine glycyltransferase (peptidoglycan interpeptide bridge formation enzyme)
VEAVVEVVEERDGRRWNEALANLPGAHALQSAQWAETKRQVGWAARPLLFRDRESGRPLAAATFLCRRLPRLPLAVAYVPKGPALDRGDLSLAKMVLAGLEQEARQSRAIFVKIDPDVREDREEGVAFTRLLQERGWRASREQIQYRNTLLSDLTPSEDALLAGMKSKTRYNVRLASRRGVTVRAGQLDDLSIFYEMYNETGRRDGFIVRPFDYYRHVWETFLRAGLAHLLLAEVEGEAVAGLILFRFALTAWYMYGASTSRHRKLMPNHLLQWEAMRWAKAQGCTTYDWWGAPDVLEESDPMWGVYRFKVGFGGEFVPHIGAWDFPVSRPLYWLYTVAMPRVLDLMRRRHSVEAGM